jgi:hypothetical protein
MWRLRRFVRRSGSIPIGSSANSRLHGRGSILAAMVQAVHRDHCDDHGATFFRQQSTVCFAFAKMALSPEHRATFLRLAWHWRAAARVADIMDEPALD